MIEVCPYCFKLTVAKFTEIRQVPLIRNQMSLLCQFGAVRFLALLNPESVLVMPDWTALVVAMNQAFVKFW